MFSARRTNSKAPLKSSRGFTLIELMVVIGIIVLLISILLPAIAGARARAYAVSTMALLQGLSNNCDQYFTQFDAYPGPATSTVTTATSNKISGTQNLLIALSCSIYPTTPSPAPTNYSGRAIPGSSPVVYADAGNFSGPTDWTATPARAYPPYYNPNVKEVSSAGYASLPGGIKGATSSNSFAFPTIFDRYPDALPILYFRATPLVTGTISYDSNFNASQGSPAIVSENSSTIAAYYRADNSEYLDSPGLVTATGLSCPQSGLSQISGSGTGGYLATLISGETAGATINSHGGFLLMSAGISRVYGPNTAKSNKSDSNFVFGGH